uniref:Uncharacterized protein n=1 Tax=Oryza sativa subsp. japonica TaxID=39947 RepID=Q33BG5_ORYSJ|nr:hypothetical protein LOC_Os10g02060 [Oryza sativa Japonica Group]
MAGPPCPSPAVARLPPPLLAGETAAFPRVTTLLPRRHHKGSDNATIHPL